MSNLIGNFISFEHLLQDYIKPFGFKDTVKLWLAKKPLATMNCMRAELEIKYNG